MPNNLDSENSDPARELASYARRQTENVPRAFGAFPEPTRLDSFPGYEVEHLVHRGGQGFVYKALELSTGRHVALKIMREGANTQSIDRVRFEREVRILSKLDHPNIVTARNQGTTPEGPYYVMEFVEGEPFDRYVEAEGLSVRDTLRLFIRICQAVNAAHLRGVIHRDLKPRNILIDRNGEPRILDFGLAKVEEEAVAETVTAPGQFIGSLPWASPEQASAHGSGADTRSDVYALGVVLYQALAGCFPYDVTGTAREVVDRVTLAPPRPLRQVDRSIDSDVETIVFRCLQKEPDRRYQNAGELAADIERFLADKPIDARRDSTWYVLSKLAQRHRAAATATLSIVAVSLVAAVSITLLYGQAVRSERRATLLASEAREKARIARDTVAFLVEEVSSKLKELSGGNDLRTELLQGAYEKLEALTIGSEDDPLLRADLARAHFQLGDIAALLGDLDGANVHLFKAAGIRDELTATDSDWKLKDELSINYVRIGDVAKQQGDLKSTKLFYERALAIDEALVATRPDNAHLLDNLSWSYERLGGLALRTGDLEKARAYQARRRAMTDRLVAAEPDNPIRLMGLFSDFFQQAELAAASLDWEEAVALATSAIEIGERLVVQETNGRFYRNRLVRAYLQAAMCQERVGGLDSAAERYDQARALAAELVQVEPEMMEHLELLARAHQGLAGIAEARGDFLGMEIHSRQSLTAAESQLAASPSDEPALQEKFYALRSLSDALDGQGRFKEGELLTEEALALGQELAGHEAAPAGFLRQFAQFLLSIRPESSRDPTCAVAVAERAAEFSGWRDPAILTVLAQAYFAKGEKDLAVHTLQAAREHVRSRDSAINKTITELMGRWVE